MISTEVRSTLIRTMIVSTSISELLIAEFNFSSNIRGFECAIIDQVARGKNKGHWHLATKNKYPLYQSILLK